MKKKLLSIQHNKKKNRSRAGYTMTEILLVVAILVVVFAVGLVGLASAQTNLRQKELDSKAEVIYMAAQNRLTELTAEGRKHLLDSSRSGVYEVDAYPVDAQSGMGSRELFYVSSDSLGTGSAAGILLPENRIEKELRDANWVIEYDAESGSIYAVFYSEKDMDYTPETFNPLRIKRMRIQNGAKVGYYGGDFVATLETSRLEPQIIIHNEERLYAVLSCAAPDGGTLDFKVTLSDAFGNKWTKTIKREEQRIANRAWVYELTLDKLTEGKRFKELYPNLIPGSDITVSFTAMSQNDLIDASTTQAKTNSLFDSVEGNTARITYARHLQNLDETSGLNNAKVNINKAEQRNNLYFNNDEDNPDDWYSLYGGNAFLPINNPRLKSYTGSYTLTENTAGTEGRIRGVIYGLKTEKGMFDTFYGDRILDVTLSGAEITGGENAGAIAGSVQKIGTFLLEGCQVYLDASEGDLEGKTEKDIWIRGSRCVGGLIGKIDADTNIENCFAATVLGTKETEYAGGLVGLAQKNLYIEKSYADCYLYGKTVGGLAGSAVNGNVSLADSYAAGYIFASKDAAGFFPVKSAKMENSYAVFGYRMGAEQIYPTTAGGSTTNNVYYISPSISVHAPANTGTAISYDNLSQRESSAAMLGTAFSAATGGSNTEAYNLMKQGLGDYSFPKLATLPHFGDWEAHFEDETPVYYEEYKGASETENSYGVFGANLDTLSKKGTAIGDGYGIIYSEAPQKEVHLQYHDGNGLQKIVLSPETAVPINTDGEEYYLLKFPKEVMNTAYAPKEFYQEIQIDGNSYYYNPHFARTMTADRPDKVSSVVYIRSARQLYSLSLYYGDYAETTEKSVYTQGLNIDYTSYQWEKYSLQTDGVSVQEPIGKGTTRTFNAVYDGGYKTIKGISFANMTKNSYYAGMFGDNSGTLRNIALVSEYAGNEKADRYIAVENNIESSKATAYIGVIAGKNSKIIRNCAAAGYTIKAYTYRNSQSYIGGLVGYNSGTIRNCSAETPQMKLSATYASVNMAGFAGRNTGGIYSCYAISAIEVMESKQGSVTASGFAGANSGTIQNAYCTASVTTSGSASGYGFSPVGGTIRECYLLNNGTYFYVEKLTSYNLNRGDARVKDITGESLKKLSLNGFSKAESSYCYQKTTSEEELYPYPTSVKKSDGSAVHYGNWVIEAQLGETGVFYWEHETGGSNAGYHFRYIGIKDGKGVNGSSLCTVHDDGGIVKEFGYGYYVEKNKGFAADLSMQGFAEPGKVNETASKALENQISNFEIYAYTTGTGGESHLYLSDNLPNGKWKITKSKGTNAITYQFTVCPFFANSFSYDGILIGDRLISPNDAAEYGNQLDAPGSKNNNYKIRSAMQLQYINWNSYNCNTTSAVATSNGVYNTKFPYLVYVSGDNASTGAWNAYWEQTHDVNHESKAFTPIGSLYYTNDSYDGTAYIAYFGGAYDGKDYTIKNLEIQADVDMVGLFGITAGARLQNIVLYSEQSNTIEITDKSSKWYCIGGLVGFAAKGKNNLAQIENCTVSGYKILVSRKEDGDWGGASIGGLAGASNMDLSKCTAVNDIEINAGYSNVKWQNIRVGGLVGNLRAVVDNAYCGGTIRSTMKQNGSLPDVNASASVWTGGISGGVVMISYGMKDLVGATDTVAEVKNSYTYVEMPKSGSNMVRGSQAIASLGEMQHTGFKTNTVPNPNVRITNCYAYAPSVKNTDQYNTLSTKKNYWNGQTYIIRAGNGVEPNNYRDILLDNSYQTESGEMNAHSPFVTYEQLSAKSGQDSVKEWLNAGGGNFDFVTIEENGAKIDGKYSYPGNDRSLDGLNYSFPTILKQNNTLGQKVSVHYGRWPKGELYWLETRKTFDLLEMYDAASGISGITVKLKASDLPMYSFIDEAGSVISAENAVATAESTSWNAADAVYEVFLKGVRTGISSIRATLNGNNSDLMVNVTANLNLQAEPAGLDTIVNGEEAVFLTAKSVSGSKDFTQDVAWTLVMDDENIATASAPIYDSDKKAWKVVIKGEEAGETRLMATASYKITLNGEEQTFTESTIVLINVTEQKGTAE